MLINTKLIVLLLSFLYIVQQANAQSDTVYIYEDIIVYDTVVVYDTVFVQAEIESSLESNGNQVSVLQLDTINKKANLVVINDQKTATIPINHIILNENININNETSESMKKATFFGIVFFAFQAMVLAQTNYEASVGTGIWWQNGNLANVDKPHTPLLNAGLYAKRNFTDTKFGIKTGIEYSYLLGSSDYKKKETTGVWHSTGGNEFDDLNRNYGAGHHCLSIPFLVYYNKFRVLPFIGFNYNYLATGMQTSETGTAFFNDSNNFGLNGGLGFKVNQHFLINLEYKHNLTNDFGESITSDNNTTANTILGNSYNLSNAQVKLSIVYALKKKSE